MNKNVFLTIKKELRSTIRDRKSLLMMFATPIFIPVFIFIFSMLFTTIIESAEETQAVGHMHELSYVELAIIDELNIEFELFESEEDMRQAFEDGYIMAFVTIQEDGMYRIYGDQNDNDSFFAISGIVAYLEAYNTVLAHQYLAENDIDPANVFAIIQYDVIEIEGAVNPLVAQLLFLGFVFAISSITASAIQAATDSTAGEKERGTLETLLTFPIKSKELITGKYIACVIACIATAILCGILLVASLAVATNMFEIYEGIYFSLDTEAIVTSFALLLAYSLFISVVSIVLASMTKTYKEAQGTLMPLAQLPMIPFFMNMFGVELTNLLAAVPILNHTMILFELIAGNVDRTQVAIMFVSTLVYVVIGIRYLASQYKSEKVLFSI
ncbi:MAG: ABC transporter permease [Oscillospiraceae bacterium]|nr:ABC transporter permease [Oscillospiraceae bacterium]